MTGALAGIYAGMLFAMCGWNKWFHPRRSVEMLGTMRRLYGRDGESMAATISLAEFLFGTTLATSSLARWSIPTALSASVLMAICAVGFWTVARRDMERQWKPKGWLDYAACVMWTSEVQLFALCAIAFTEAIT